ncbi:MAG TPA: peptidoglycan-binding domain-containing protein [Nitrosomonas sp.]|nr:peptidoglycan-binding domain-containing protein [Nitrosomonas sp.]
MKSHEVKILSTAIVFLFTAGFLSGCGEKEKTDWIEKRAQLNAEKAKEKGKTIIAPEPLAEEPTSMESVLDGIDATGKAISETADNMMDAIEDSITIAQDKATDMHESAVETIDATIVESVAEILDDSDEVVTATPDLIRRVQQALTKAGYKPGPADGVSGAKTVAALKSFQQENNLATGALTRETLRALRVDY